MPTSERDGYSVAEDKEAVNRFWSHVSIPSFFECWPWHKAHQHGYGAFTIQGKTHGAHRASWLIVHKTIPDGLFVLHKCDNRICVNPSHLFLGTQKDNMQDMREKGRQGVRGKNWNSG